jgi:hypothetical protein
MHRLPWTIDHTPAKGNEFRVALPAGRGLGATSFSVVVVKLPLLKKQITTFYSR